MKVSIITPDRVLLERDVGWVVVPGSDGDFQVLPGHTPLLTGVSIGRILLREKNKDSLFATAGGFCEVLPDTVTLLVSAAESMEDIDVERAQESHKRARKRLESKEEGIDKRRANLAEKRALNRIRIATKVSDYH